MSNTKEKMVRNLSRFASMVRELDDLARAIEKHRASFMKEYPDYSEENFLDPSAPTVGDPPFDPFIFRDVAILRGNLQYTRAAINNCLPTNILEAETHQYA